MSIGRLAAEQIAAALAGRGFAVPTAGEPAFLVSLPDGRAPLLVREYQGRAFVCLTHKQGWMLRNLGAAGLAEVAAAAAQWAEAQPPGTLTLFELAEATRAALHAPGAPWRLRIPGAADPAEIAVEPENPDDDDDDAPSVGVFDRRVVILRGDRIAAFDVPDRAVLSDVLAWVSSAATGPLAR